MSFLKVVGIAVAALSFNAQATLMVIDTSLWTDSVSPSSGKLSTKDTWVRKNTNNPTKLSNSSGALISDFSLAGDFTFNGLFSPTFASNATCEAAAICDDDDILGLVFGWQDADNHYRLGWSQNDGSNPSGVTDITGKSGLFLVKEENGISNTIKNWDSTFWLENAEYTFSISRFDDAISLVVEGIMQNIAGGQGPLPPINPVAGSFQSIAFSTNDTTFTSGNVGVYTESQTGSFSNMTVNVSTPATLAMLMLGGFGLLYNRRECKDNAKR